MRVFFHAPVLAFFRSISLKKIPSYVDHIFPDNNTGIWLIWFSQFEINAICPPFDITYKYNDFGGVLW